MPFLDVTGLLSDPDLADTFDVIRRQEQVGQDGVSRILLTVFKGVVGVVSPASPNQLQQTPDGRRMQNAVTVVTTFRLQGVAKDEVQRTYQPDLVRWSSDLYQVRAINEYTRFGAGFVEAVSEAVDTQDLPPEVLKQVIGSKIFSDPSNSNMVD